MDGIVDEDNVIVTLKAKDAEDAIKNISEDEDAVIVTLKDVEDAIKNIKELEKEIENAPKKLSILCAGGTGVGKSTLLNGLIGCKADSLPVGDTLERGTDEVTERTFTLRGITVTIWDTPGLEGSEGADKNYLEKIKEKCADFDIFLYCIKADEKRAIELSDERSSLLRYTELFGPELWKYSVVALTFSNKIVNHYKEEAKIGKKKDADAYVEREFKRKIDEWETKIQRALKKKMDRETVEKVPVLPAGLARRRDLPGHNYWLSRLFVNFEDRLKKDSKMSFFQIYQHRLRSEKDMKESNSSENIEDQDLVYDSTFKKNAKIAAVSTSVGVAGVAVGATIGATIGALAIGLPTFGAAAAGGLILGGAIGAAIGGLSATASARLMQLWAKERKIKKLKEQSKKVVMTTQL